MSAWHSQYRDTETEIRTTVPGILEAGAQLLEAPRSCVDPKSKPKAHPWPGEATCLHPRSKQFAWLAWGLQPLCPVLYCICHWYKHWAKPEPSGKGTPSPLALLEGLDYGGGQHHADPEAAPTSKGFPQDTRGPPGLGGLLSFSEAEATTTMPPMGCSGFAEGEVFRPFNLKGNSG